LKFSIFYTGRITNLPYELSTFCSDWKKKATLSYKFSLFCSDWMDRATKEMAKKKARGMVEHIGYPSGIKVINKRFLAASNED